MVNSSRRKRSTEILTMLMERADVQGYLTTEDLMEIYPDLRGDVDYLDSIVMALRRRGVDILDGETPQGRFEDCLLYTSPSPRDRQKSRMPSSA